MALSNYEKQKRWREKHRALYNLQQRNRRKNLPVPVLAEPIRTPQQSASATAERSGEARESTKSVLSAEETRTLADKDRLPSDHSRGGQTSSLFQTKKVGEFRMLVLPEEPEERATIPVVKPKVFFNDHGAQISESVWNALQEKKRVAKENGYEFDPQ